MAGFFIPALQDYIVSREIVPRLPWHTRPILQTVSRAWRNELDSIDENIGQLTRLAQPLQCKVAVEYPCRQGYRIQIFDGQQWRNAPPNRSDSRYDGILSVIDGTLYSVRSTFEESRICALDIGSGLWQWRTVFIEESMPAPYILSICRRLGRTGGYFVYRSRGNGNDDHIVYVNNEGQMEGVTAVQLPAVQRNRFFRINPRIGFHEIENRLYVFGTYNHPGNTLAVCFYDFNTNTWNMDEVYTVQRWLQQFDPSPTDLNLTRTVVCVACITEHLYIVRYNSSTRRWVIVANTDGPNAMSRAMTSWSWSVECDSVGRKHLYIYELRDDQRRDDRYLLHRWSVLPSDVLNDEELRQEPLRCLMRVDRSPTFPRAFRVRYHPLQTLEPVSLGFAM